MSPRHVAHPYGLSYCFDPNCQTCKELWRVQEALRLHELIPVKEPIGADRQPPSTATVRELVAGEGENKEHWKQLCAQAAVEQDPKRLMALIEEITRMLDEKALHSHSHKVRVSVQRKGRGNGLFWGGLPVFAKLSRN
jgi:hypothetical protein